MFCGVSYAVHAKIVLPPGFEELAQGQKEWVTVSLYGHTLGLYEADIDLENVTFINPKDLLSQLKPYVKTSPEVLGAISDAFQKPLPRHSQLACSSNGGAAGCDSLQTDSVGIIYDENNAKINLYLNKDYMLILSGNKLYFDPSSDQQNAFIHQQNINIVKNTGSQSLSVQGIGSLALSDNSYLLANWNYSYDAVNNANAYQSISLPNAIFRYDLGKKYYFQAGRMDASDIFSYIGGNIQFNQLPIDAIDGIRIGSTLGWLDREQVSIGTPVTLLLSRDARVDVYRDKLLLGSFYLKSGIQAVDTRNFPNGSYDLTLRIYEDNKLVRTETLPYSNVGEGISDTPQWFVQGGKLVDKGNDLLSNTQHLMQGGVKLPIQSNVILTTGATLTGKQHFLESALDWYHGFNNALLTGTLSVRGSYLLGRNGVHGNAQQVNYNNGFSLSFYRTERFSFSRTERHYQNSNLSLSIPLGQWSVQGGYQFSNGNLLYHDIPYFSDPSTAEEALYREKFSSEKMWYIGLSRSFLIKGMNVHFNSNLFVRSDMKQRLLDKGALLSVGIALNYIPDTPRRESWSLGISHEYNHENQQNSQTRYDAAYRRYFGEDGQQEAGLILSGQENSLNAILYGNDSGKYGNSHLSISDAYQFSSKQHSLGVSGSYSSAVAVTTSGIYWGTWSGGQPASAVIAQIEDPQADKNTQVDVLLSGYNKMRVAGQQQLLLTTPVYQPFSMEIREPLQVSDGVSSEVVKGLGTQKMFMLPGKLYRQKIKVTAVYTYLGRLMDQQKKPLVEGRPINVKSWSPLGKGGISMETNTPLDILYVLNDAQLYQCDIAERSIKDVIRYLGNVTCHITELAQSPAMVQHKVRDLLASKTELVTAMH